MIQRKRVNTVLYKAELSLSTHQMRTRLIGSVVFDLLRQHTWLQVAALWSSLSAKRTLFLDCRTIVKSEMDVDTDSHLREYRQSSTFLLLFLAEANLCVRRSGRRGESAISGLLPLWDTRWCVECLACNGSMLAHLRI